MPSTQFLTADEEQRLALAWTHGGDQIALGKLISSQLGLVVRIAQEFRFSGPAMEDLIQEGNLGLTVAARKFDPQRGTRLSTYAVWWIRAYIIEHIVRSHGPMRVGTTRAQRKIFFGLGKAKRQLEHEQAGSFTRAELATKLGVTEEEVENMLPRLSGRDISLDASRSIDDGRSIGNNLSDESSPEDDIAEVLDREHARRELAIRMKDLDPRERAIIKGRFLRKDPLTLAELGAKLGVSRERVRQLELRAKAKLGVPTLQ